MGFGIRMWTLWRLRLGVGISLVIATLAATWSLGEVSLSPPSITPRAIEIATATTQVVVDTPTSTLLDLRQDTSSFEGLRNRSVLLGNVIASRPVLEDIARRADVPVDLIQVSTPRTPEQPRAAVPGATKRHASDILKYNDEYRLSIQANPTVPVLYISAQTPDARSAKALANAAVDGLRAHLTELASVAETPTGAQVKLMQLGRARGGVINGGMAWQAAVLAFLLTFTVSCATVLFLARLRDGWRKAELAAAS